MLPWSPSPFVPSRPGRCPQSPSTSPLMIKNELFMILKQSSINTIFTSNFCFSSKAFSKFAITWTEYVTHFLLTVSPLIRKKWPEEEIRRRSGRDKMFYLCSLLRLLSTFLSCLCFLCHCCQPRIHLKYKSSNLYPDQIVYTKICNIQGWTKGTNSV